MVKARKYVVTKKFRGLPARDDFEIVEFDLPPLGNGEVLVEADWVSVDPYQRIYNQRLPVPYDQLSMQTGIVRDSKNPIFPVGTRVTAHKGWCDYSVFNPSTEIDFIGSKVQKVTNLKSVSPSACIGALGLVVGAPAYYGFLDVCQPAPGETVVVTGAAGAVGSLVGQIAKIKGCTVIGFCGSDAKVKWLETELGFDRAVNYKTADVVAALKEAAPDGVDCFYDNVGGQISSSIIGQMRPLGRVAVLGAISSYNEEELPQATMLQMYIMAKELTIKGVRSARYADTWYTSEGFAQMARWIESGQLRAAEHVTEGFERIFDAFLGVLRGENVGKAVVKIA